MRVFTVFKVVNYYVNHFHSLSLYFCKMSLLLHCSIIINLFKPCLFLLFANESIVCFFYSQWTRWWRFCPVWAPQASQRCFLWGMQNLWVIYSFLLFRFSLTLLLLLLLLLLLIKTMHRCSCNMLSSLGEYHYYYHYFILCRDVLVTCQVV